jgi:DNA-binding LacI/PurR family transcriptional regulator
MGFLHKMNKMKNKDIAKELGISQATFSLVINNKPGVSSRTREVVINYLHSHGYSDLLTPPPNTSSQKNICFIVYKRNGAILDQSPFFLLLMESIESSSRKRGYGNSFFTLDRRNPLDEQIQNVNSMDICGAVIFATEMEDDDIELLTSLKMPIVLLDNDFKNKIIDSVCIDNNLGTFQAVEHLVNMGHRKIGYLQSKRQINSFRERYRGYLSALDSFGLSLEPQYHYHVDYCEEGSYQDFKKIMNSKIALPTALFTDDDLIASGVIKALNEKGIKVPDDISIIGFDDRPICEKITPSLSSIRVPRLSFGSHAIDLLVNRLENDSSLINMNYSVKMRIGTFIKQRNSVKKL